MRELRPTAMTILGAEYMTAVDNAGNFWVRLQDVGNRFNIRMPALRKRVQATIRSEWQMMLRTPSAGGEQDTKFVNQNAVVKLAMRANDPALQDFADAIIDLGVRAKRGDMTVVEEIVEKRLDDAENTTHIAAKIADLEYTDFKMQRELAKVSNKIRNEEIARRTNDRERVAISSRLSDDTNLCTTGKTAAQIKELGKVKETRDALSPDHLALQRFVELRQTSLMRMHDAQGYSRIRGACEHLHEKVGAMAQQLELHSDRLIRDRRHDVKDKQLPL